MNLITVLEKLLVPVNKILQVATIILFVGMTLCVLLQVLLRYVFAYPMPWTEEASRFLFIWATFMGAAIAFHDGGHLNVKLFVSRLPKGRPQAFFALLADICCFWFLGMYIVQGFTLASRLSMMGQTPPSMDFLLMGWVYLAIPIGSVLMIANILPGTLRHLVQLVSGTAAEGDKA